MFRITLLILTGLMPLGQATAQTNRITAEQSEPILFTPSGASQYIQDLLQLGELWSPSGDSLRSSLERLLGHYQEPFDSIASRLDRFNYSTHIRPTTLVDHDTLPLRWLNDYTFIIDTLALEKEPFLIRQTIIQKKIPDSTTISFKDSIPFRDNVRDSVLLTDTISQTYIDTLFLESRNVRLYQYLSNSISPGLSFPGRTHRLMADSSALVLTRSSRVLMADQGSPYYIVPSEKMPDSLQVAVQTLLQYTDTRDSILLHVSNLDGQSVPFWLSESEDELIRLWVKNEANDSITIWMGNPSKKEMILILEDNVNLERREKKLAEDIPITTVKPQRALAKMQPLQEIPVYWNFGLVSAFTLNQTFLSNWSRGGQNSLATNLDIRRTANYTNRVSKITWNNSGRLRYGTVRTEEHGSRTNTDILEFNSQYNKVIREKIDFSTAFYGKTQVARGYRYPNDSVVVSKFLNPGTFTIGVGVEYKPSNKTRINFAPLSYKNTFVLDTANINQRTHGIDPDRKTRQEMGGQLVIQTSSEIFDGTSISNSVRLFSGYLDKPQNVDVDWEMVIEKRINWFFTVRLNLHTIYDDNVRFVVLDRDDNPVLMPDGSEKRVPKIQFKQFLGLTLSFKI